MQCKDIPTLPVLQFLEFCSKAEFKNCGQWGTSFIGDDGKPFENSVQQGMPPGVPRKLVQTKMRSLITRGLVDGCTCGCRGDFVLTDAGRDLVMVSPPSEVQLA